MASRIQSLHSDREPAAWGSQLVTDLDPTLLQGVPLSICLGGCGRYLDSAVRVKRQVSRPTRHFDAFLSHDWGTSRKLKYGCLLILYNSRAAVVGSLLTSIALGVLCTLKLLPRSDVVVLIGYAVFLFLLCFWQRIRHRCSASPTVFLDKLCINQSDPSQKKLGILGLGAFLRASKKLVILWSPRYFHRLWCTYEIVTFLRLHGPEARVQIMPVKMARLLVLMAVMWQSVQLTGRFMIASIGDSFWFPVSLITVLLEILVLGPLYNYQGLEIFADIDELPEQLHQFQIQKAQCTCCTLGHRNPETGAKIECDRQLVLSTLQLLHSGEERPESPEASLEWFNSLVQSQLSLQGSVGGDVLLLPDYAVFLLGANVPWIATKIPDIMNGPAEPLEGFSLFIWVLKQVLDHAMLYMVNFFFMRMNMLFWKYVAPALVFTSRKSLAVILVVPLAVLAAVAWVPWWLLLQQSEDDSWVPLLPFMQLLIIDVALFFGFRPSISSEDRGSHHKAVEEAEDGAAEPAAGHACSYETESDDRSGYMGVAGTFSLELEDAAEVDVKWSESADFFSI